MDDIAIAIAKRNKVSPTLIEDAVENYLENHPESTTMVADGSITKAKLNQELQASIEDVSSLSEAIENKADAIVVDTDETGKHDLGRSSFVKKIVFKPSENTFGKYLFANKLHLPYTKTGTKTIDDVTFTAADDFYILNGKCGGTNKQAFWGTVNITGATGNHKIFLITSENINMRLVFDFKINGNTTSVTVNTADGTNGIWSDSIDLTGVTTVEVRTVTRYTTATFNNAKMWFGIFPADVTVYPTNETSGSEFEYNVNDMMQYIDTLMSNSVVNYIADTKTYVDNLEVDVLAELPYCLPEHFGAVGDGVADDSTALQNCIDYAVTNAKAIRGYGVYKISTGIEIQSTKLDVYINAIIYTGDDAAVTLTGYYNRYRFNSITATAGGASAVGLRCTASSTTSGMIDSFSGNNVECHYIRSNGNTFELVYPETATTENTYYNVFRFLCNQSLNANVFYIDSPRCNGIDFYGKIAWAANGYFCYETDRCGVIKPRFHQFSLERHLKNGIYGNAELIECRTRELIDKRSIANPDQGLLFVIANRRVDSSMVRSGGVDMLSVNVDDALTYAEKIAEAKEVLENGGTTTAAWEKLGTNTRPYSIIENCIRAAGNLMTTNDEQRIMPVGDMVIIDNHVAFVPSEELYYKVNVSTFAVELTDENNYNYITPTVFDIDTSSAEIYLDYSYGCFTIDHFDVIQHSGKTAKVYDKLGNILFDGTALGAGIFHFNCSFVPLESISITLSNGTVKTASGYTVRRVYTGENETWSVSKEELIEPPAQA